jgi:hypothetical protein
MGTRQNGTVFSENEAPSNRAIGPVRMAPLGDPFPIRMNRTLRYSQLVTLTAGASGLFGTEQIFRLSSLFDPDLTGTGHQPYGFDSLAALYYRYKVNAVRVCLRFSDPSADGVLCAAQFQAPSVTQTVTGADVGAVMERAGVWTHNLNNTGEQAIVLDQYFPMHVLVGVTPQQFAANLEDYQSLCTTNPARGPFLRIATAALDGSSTPTVRLEATLMFYSSFFERIGLSQS